jgi:hypothetical protein
VANRTPEAVSGAGDSLNPEVVRLSWLGLSGWIGFDCIEPLDQTFRKRLQIVP